MIILPVGLWITWKTEKFIDIFRFALPVDNLETWKNTRLFPFRFGKRIDFFRRFRFGRNGKTLDIFLSESEENYHTTYGCFPHDVKGKK